MVGGRIANDRIANIELLRGVIWRDPNGFENLLASDDRMCPVRRDVQSSDGDTCFMSDGLRFSWTLQTAAVSTR